MVLPRVADLKRFTSLAQRPFSLLATGASLWIMSTIFGRWAAPAIDHNLTSVGLAFAILCIHLLSSIFAAYLFGMAISVFALGTPWRDRYLVPYIPPNPRNPEAYLARIGDKTLAFWTIILLVTLASIAFTHRASDNYLLQFPSRGFQLVSFRSDNPVSQQRAMREIVRRDLARHLNPDDLRERMRVYLAADSDEVRAQAAWTVGRLQIISLEPDVRTLLKHPSEPVRIEAAIAEGQLRTANGIRALTDALNHEQHTDVLEAILIAIGLSRNTDAAMQVSKIIDQLPDAAQPAALWAIGESSATCAAQTVLTFTTDTHPHTTQCAAMESLKKIATTKQIHALREQFYQDDAWCELQTWYGRSADPIRREFHRVIVSAERTREKALDALFNIAGPNLKEDLATIINDTAQERLDRKHARRLYDLLDPAHPRTPREARNCPTEHTP